MRGGVFFYRLITRVLITSAVILVLTVLPAISFAQTKGKVEVVKDPKVDSLIGDYLVGNKAKSIQPAAADEGYRVQIYNGDDRKGAYDAEAKFQEKYPEQRTYITYREPNFKVHVGDFRTRLEAEKMMHELKALFNGLFIIQEKINPPKADTE